MNETEELELGAKADIGSQRIARVYAEALLNAAEKRQEGDSVIEELKSLIAEVLGKNVPIEKFLSSGAITRDKKKQVLETVFSGRTSDLVTNLLMVLNDRDRLELLRPIAKAAGELWDKRARRVPVQVQTAVPLAEDQTEKLRAQIKNSFHLEPILQLTIEPALLGGMVLRIGDWVYDSSVRTRLETICHQLIARSSHEIQSRRDRFSSANGN